jgi:hypothetical protein
MDTRELYGCRVVRSLAGESLDGHVEVEQQRTSAAVLSTFVAGWKETCSRSRPLTGCFSFR